jgi:hypothetical protein
MCGKITRLDMIKLEMTTLERVGVASNIEKDGGNSA